MTRPETTGRWANRIGIANGRLSLPQCVPLEDERILDRAVDTYWQGRTRPMVGDHPGAREIGVLDVLA